jgi:thioredoxin:protein disulfide reductase
MSIVRRVLAFVLWGLVASSAHAKFLEPDQAFRFGATVEGDAIVVKYLIADGYYLYRERFKFALDPETSGSATLGEPVFPKGEIKYDETFEKDVEHYRKEVVVRVPVVGAKGPVTLLSTSQGCADAGLCYPPQVAKVALTMGGAPPALARTPAPSPGAIAPPLDDSSRIRQTLASRNLGAIALVFGALGLLLAFTPCVLPMLPILSSILVGRAGSAAAKRSSSFVLALAYSAGFAIVYTLLGVAAGLAGEGLAAALQAPWVLTLFALLLVALALSMFDVYTLQVPAALQTRLTALSDRAGGGSGASAGRLAGVAVMGALSALIVGPCVAAPLAGALVYISQTRDVVVGGLALFSLAAGMSVPLLLLGLSAGPLLPRAGAWMDAVKRFFGALLLGVALWMISPIVPTWTVMLGWAVLAIVAAVDLRVFDALASDASGAARLAKGVGVVLLLAGAVEFVGLATGGRDVLQPLAHLAREGRATGGASAQAAVPFERVKSIADLDRRIATAGKPVLLDFYADWCVSCKEMERFTYTDARVADRLKGFVLLQADVTANDEDDRALLKRFALFGPPGIVFFAPDGRPLVDASVIGYQDAERFLASLAAANPTSTAASASAATVSGS